jgi:PleD family two-component response regulator
MLTQLCAILYKSLNISRAPHNVNRLMAAKPSLKPIARVLVVDDEQDITNIIKKGLEGNKILVDEFTNSSHALDIFAGIQTITVWWFPTSGCPVLQDLSLPKKFTK